MCAQQNSFGIAEIDIKRVPHAARWMRCWNVERFEVVPIGFDFRTFSNGEAHTDKHIDESVPGLCDQMQRTALGQFE